MHSNTPFNRNSMENAESYHEVFKVLDSLGMADLKETFQEHCIQVFNNCMYTWWLNLLACIVTEPLRKCAIALDKSYI